MKSGVRHIIFAKREAVNQEKGTKEKAIMKKLITIMLLTVGMAQGASAQDAIASIRKTYNETKASADQMINAYANRSKNPDEVMSEGGWPPAFYETTVMQNLPATGPHKETFRFFYYDYEDYEREGGPVFWRKIHFATVAYNFAARNYYEEYLFDEKGNIQFIYARNSDMDEYIQLDFRFYFDKGKLIHAIIQGRNDLGGDFTSLYTGKNPPQKYKDYVNGYINYTKKVKALFDAIDSGEHF